MIDADEQALFAVTVRDAVGAASRTGSLDGVLADLGWAEAVAADEQVAVATWFEAQGAVAATSGALDALLRHHLGRPDGSVVLPALGRTDPPGRVEGACVPVDGLLLGDPGGEVLVVAGSLAGSPEGSLAGSPVGSLAGSPVGSLVGAVPTAHLDVRLVGGLDPDLGLRRLAARCAPASDAWAPLGASWADAVAAGQRALGHELVGASRTMLRLARDHAVERVQFGRPIGAFQAVRHRLAEALVAVEAAEAALDAAWVDGTPWAAMVAKAVAGDSARTVRRHCQQVLAGIGFTTDHDLHRYVRRTMVLDALLGSSRTLTKRIGTHLISAGEVPPLTPL